MLDSEIASIFIAQALKNPDVRWKAASGEGGEWRDDEFAKALAGASTIAAAIGDPKRIGTQEGAEKKPPYLKWQLRTLRAGTVELGNRKRQITRLNLEAKIFRVDVFQSGLGSFDQARGCYDAIMDCVVGVPCTPIRDKSNNLLANVVMSKYLDTHRRSYNNPDSIALVTEFGVVCELALEANF